MIEELDRAGLRGHGGAAYPTGAKLRAVAQAGGRPVIVVNGCEGEPTMNGRINLRGVERLPLTIPSSSR